MQLGLWSWCHAASDGARDTSRSVARDVADASQEARSVLLQQLRLQRAEGQELRTLWCDPDLLLELHALSATGSADIALHANDHVRLDEAVVAVALEMSLMQNERIFVDEAYAMRQRRQGAASIGLGQLPGLLGDLAERGARPKQGDIALDLLMRQRVEPPLLVARRPIARDP